MTRQIILKKKQDKNNAEVHITFHIHCCVKSLRQFGHRGHFSLFHSTCYTPFDSLVPADLLNFPLGLFRDPERAKKKCIDTLIISDEKNLCGTQQGKNVAGPAFM